MIKVLWVDWGDIFYYMRGTIEALEGESINVSELTWFDREIEGHNVERVVDACRKADIAILHFGNIPQKEAAERLALIKETGVKVIAITCSVGLLGAADAFIAKPFLPSSLVKLIKKLCAS